MASQRWWTWREAMGRALYGTDGFYVTPGAPARAFRTAAHASPLWSVAVLELATRLDAALSSPDDFTILDVGAGGGELLSALAEQAPSRWSLCGVDVAARPDGLPERVGWLRCRPDSVTGLLLAVELLDVEPVDAVERTGAGPRLIEVNAAGQERLGALPTAKDQAWLDRWWQLASLGDRGEIGHTRDSAWRDLTASVARGLAVAVDYAAVPGRDVAGTLTAYRDGRQQVPVADGTCDITAHVLMESLTEDGDRLISQRDALASLGIRTSRPSYDGDPARYVRALSRSGEAAELTDPAGLGGFTWLLHHVRTPPVL